MERSIKPSKHNEVASTTYVSMCSPFGYGPKKHRFSAKALLAIASHALSAGSSAGWQKHWAVACWLQKFSKALHQLHFWASLWTHVLEP